MLNEEWPELLLSRFHTGFSVYNRVRIIECVNECDVVDVILRHLAKAEAKLPAVHRARQLFPPLPEPISAAAAVCVGCARGGGNGVRDRGSRLLCQNKLSRPLVPTDSGGRSKRASPLWSPKRLPSTVLAWGGTKGISYP